MQVSISDAMRGAAALTDVLAYVGTTDSPTPNSNLMAQLIEANEQSLRTLLVYALYRLSQESLPR